MSARTSRRQEDRRAKYTAGELAWLALELCRYGAALRDRGWCAGDVLPHDLRGTALGVSRIPSTRTIHGFFTHTDRQRRRYRHQHRGHVDGCFEIGLPAPAFMIMMRAWGDEGSALLLEDAMTTAVAEIQRSCKREGRWSRVSAEESVSYAIGQRVTVRRPAISMRAGEGVER